MSLLAAVFGVGLFVVAVVVLGLEVPYWGYRIARGYGVYLRFRESRLVTCPETHRPAVVTVAARSMGLQAILSEPCLHLRECSRWPMRQDCGQDCLKQIEPSSSDLTFSAATRAS
jgi:hypothetical protein